MTPDERQISTNHAGDADASYSPPTVTFLGTLGELTQKTVGEADGETFLGLDIGEVGS
ncbi:MAG: hypothetical protein Q8K79_05825 [Solirubrobacteraceae bacterium]|nr:hypothetical protein [Solirubrobacteraceae bacterium]